MSYFRPYGKLANATVSLTNAAPGPTTLITANADEFTDVYTVIISSNDTAIQQVTLSDGTNTLGVYQVPIGGTIVDVGTIPVRGKKGGNITAAAGAVTAAKTISVTVRALLSKT